ncbi:MAG: right-handed parallel beta-helix repeat-containing protein [Planctomycetota bacterium]|jgi:parallel beta-helix repeat protein
MKPLSDVEPRVAVNSENTPGDADSVYRITSGGSYYLTADVVAASGFHAIEIAASDVTLDLNGFVVHGSAPGALYGIRAEAAYPSVEIKNGFIWGFDSGGIGDSLLYRSRVLDVRVTNTSGVGIALGARAVVRGCSVEANTNGNIAVGDNSQVIDCNTEFASAGTSIATGTGSTLKDCIASLSSVGIVAGSGSTIDSCIARDNNGNGIEASSNSLVINSNASLNDGHGISIGTYTRVENSTSNQNLLSGIRAPSRNHIVGCTVNDNDEYGIHITYAGVVDSCFLNRNTINGIRMDNGGATTITNNTVSESQHGIAVSVSSGNHIENNRVSFCSVSGINVTSVGNTIVRNACFAQPADYSVFAGNLLGPIVTTATIGASTNPHANYLW